MSKTFDCAVHFLILVDNSGALKAAELDLATARSHVQQFQEISAASEAALAALGTTHEEYKAQSEASIASFEVIVYNIIGKPILIRG